jgi:hypothetical protein
VYFRRLLACEARRFFLAAGRRGKRLTREELAELLRLHPNGSRYKSDLSWLRTMRVLPERGPIALTDAVYR